MLRSLLFVPGARPERFAKACEAGADAVCIDLEDAVPPGEKASARAAAIAYLSGTAPHPRVGLRINRIGTAFGVADLAALAASGAKPAFVMTPKVESAGELGVAYEALGAPALWPIVESALGMHRAWEIAGARGVEGILFGGADYSADIGATLAWEPMLFARSTLVNACAGAGIEVLDVPYLDVNDETGLSESTHRVRALGFTGRACIHPKQVASVNAVFTSSDAEIAHARRVLSAFEDAKGAAALLDGKLIELPVIRAARRALAAAGEG